MEQGNIILLFLGAGVFLVFVLIIVFWLFIRRSWNISVVIFRWKGDKRRPVIDLSKKAKLVNQGGVQYLRIKGIPVEYMFKNFKSENYHTQMNGKSALLLWEFSANMFAPLTTRTIGEIRIQSETMERRADGTSTMKVKDLPTLIPVKHPGFAQRFRGDTTRATEGSLLTEMDFRFDETVFKKLELLALDDLDMEFTIRNVTRVSSQYSSSWKEWLAQHGYLVGWMMFAAVVIVAIVLFYMKAPDLFAACAQRAFDAGKQSGILQKATQAVTGAPAG